MQTSIKLNEECPPVQLARGYKGPATIPESGRQIYWTGRVAIGLRHKPANNHMHGSQATWLQALLLKP